MTINFNVSPYFDDFDPTKNFHRILFKPGYAVQARELTQSQTILQNQISNFASAIYSQNTPISGGKVTTNLNCYYIRLNPTYGGTSISAGKFLNKTITDQTGTVLAKVIATAEGVTGGDPPTLIVTYVSGTQFTDNAIITPNDGSNYQAQVAPSVTGTPSTGSSSVASISSGVYYIVNGYSQSSTANADGTYNTYSIGNFVQVNPQTIILSKYNNTPSYRIGLEINESIVSYASDSSLLDPAIGASNYQAPGADRYQITLTLTTFPITVGGDSSFIELVRIENGTIVKQSDTTVYSAIDDYFAKRDYETNGDYVVQDFKLTPSANTSNSAQYNLSISKGVAYVRGYRVENQTTQVLTSDRARTTQTVPSNSMFVDYGNYFVVDTANGVFDVTSQPTVDLHCVVAANILSTNTNVYSSTLVGTGVIRGWQYVNSNGSNTASYVFNAYVSDIVTNTLTGNTASATATTITFNDISGTFSQSANAYYGAILTINSGTDAGDSRTIVAYNASTKTATVSPAFTQTPDSTSKFTISLGVSNINSIVQKNGSYGLTANANISIAGGGKSSPTLSAPTVLQLGGAPELIFPLGYAYANTVSNTSYYTTQVFRNQGFNATSKTLTLTTTAPLAFQGPVGTPFNGNVFKQLYTLINNSTGQILDFSTSGNTANITSATSITFTSNTYSTVSNVTVIASMYVSNADGSSNILKTKTLNTGNTTYGSTGLTAITGVSNTTLDLTNGQAYILNSAVNSNTPFSLYVTDVKKIAKIIDTGSPSVSAAGQALSSFTDVTTSYALDNGQRDSHYDFATLKLLPGVPRPKGNLLVVFNYYSHGGGDGYFSINSYTNETYAGIPFYTAKSGITYALRDCLDWRPSKANGTTSYYGGWEYKYPGSGQGILIPNNFSNVQNQYQFYLGRKDLLVLTKDSQFQIIEGTPSIAPLAPSQPNGSLLLANLALDPYTAYVPGQNPDGITSNLSINKVVHKRWAKSDITDLQTQVNNLEYYTTLNALEQAASSLSVSNSNGVTRPNYGILVDDFNSFAAADTTNPNYAANINIRKGQMGPVTSVNNFQLQNPVVMNSLGNLANTNSNNYAVNNIGGTTTNIFTLPYTTANLVVQQLASNTISVNPFSVVTYQGVATLNPPMDNWVNSIEVPNILITDPTLQVNQQAGGLNLTNMGDFASLPGTTSVVSSTQGGVATLNGTNSTSTPLQQGGTGSSSSFVAVPTQTYVSQITGLNNAQTSTATSPALTSADGYVTNNAVLPNIRAQEVIVRAKGMLVNTPVDCWFDGQKVNQWMTMPNTIELTGVTGTFNQDDIIGFYESNISTFFPVARVVSAYVYPNGTSVRLYVATMIQVPQTVTTSTLQNAFFDSNGVYQGSSATGTVTFTNNSFHSLHNSGTVAGIGGTFTSATNSTATNIFATEVVSNWTSFMNTYGVWGDQNNGSSYSATFPFKPTANGTYTVTYAGADSVSGSITVGGTTIVSGSLVAETNHSTTVNLTAGVSANVSWSLTNSGTYQWYAGPGVAVSITDPSGNIVWNSRTPTGLTYTNGTEYQMPGGGSLFVGATQLQLASSANTSNGYYTGATISVKSTYTYNYNYGSIYYPPYPPFSGDADSGRMTAYNSAVSQYNASIQNQLTQAKTATITLSSTAVMTANITSYNGVTRTVTVDTPVNVSFGTNSIYGNINSQYNINGTNASVAAAIHSGSGIPQLSTDEHGQFVAIFNIPGSVFFTGQRIFRIDNRVIPTQPSSATTFAEATFYATGLQTINQNLNYAASVDASATTLTRTNQQGYNVVAQNPNIDPVAQTFIISKQNYPNGVFLNSVKLFFAPFTSGVMPNSPVTVSIVGTLNGYPNGQTLPHSIVSLNANQVNTSTTPNYLDPTTATTFTFDAPVYIQSGVLYAIVVQSSSSDYNLYYGEQNKVAIASTANTTSSSTATKIGQAPYIGALFESQNSITWTADQTKDLMFVIDQCVFNTSVNPNISFVVPANLPSRKLGRQDIMQKMSANSVPNVYSYYEQNQVMDAFNVSTTDFVPSSTNINYQYQTTLSKDGSLTSFKSVTPGRFGTPTQDNIYLNDGNGERILLRSSNNSFSLMATLSSNDPNVSPVISDDGVSLYSIIYHVNNMGIDTSAITLANTGASYNANTLSVVITSGLTGSNTTNDLGVADLPVFGYTTNTSTGAISTLYVTYPGSGYIVTPSISIYDPTTRTSATANAQIVVSGETSSSGGNGYAKYFSKKVIMPAGNDAGDMRVYIDAYKPVGSQIYVYYKILSSADNQVFENQNWQLMTNTMNYTTYSTDRTNIVEYEYAPGINNLANNNISYTSTSGITYNNFIQFAIKVVIATPDRTNVPFLQDIRTVALPSGTGI